MRSTIFDQYFAENLSADAGQHAWWTGRYQFPLTLERQYTEPTWLPLLARHQVRSSLLYDPAATTPLNPQLFSASKAVSLEDAAELHYQQDQPRFVRTAISRIQQMADSPQQSELLWIHAGGLPIDVASSAFHELYADDEPGDIPATFEDAVDADSEHPDFPRFWKRKRASPRELADAQLVGVGWKPAVGNTAAVDWQHRRDLYSGQVTQWDAWIGRILDAVTELRKTTPVLMVFTAAAGEHLGEHGDQLPAAELFDEQIHAPLIIELPLDEPLSGRRHQLAQPVDLPATLLDWLQVPPPADVAMDGTSLLPIIRDDQPAPRELACLSNGSLAGIRTPEFYVRHELEAIGLHPQEKIFIKPDDRWDTDDVQRQYIDSADELLQRWKDFSAAIRNRNA